METATDIVPSPQARQLFNRMVQYAGEDMKLTFGQTIALGCEMVRGGVNPRVCAEVGELQTQNWIEPSGDGGWILE